MNKKKLGLTLDCKNTDREAIMLSNHDLERKINQRLNEIGNKKIEDTIKELLDKRPRYSRRIPVKLYMKFHTVGIYRGKIQTGEVYSIREVGKGYRIYEENKLWLERKKIF